MLRFSRTPIACVVTAAGLLAATCVSAQSSLVLEEVIVTAQKKSESLSDTPMTVNVVSGEALTEFSNFNFEDINKMTAGVVVVGSGFDTDISTRGLGTELNAGVAPRVTLYFDQAHVSQQRGLFTAMFDLERFEILRGPQGTLYGKSSPAGAITMQSTSPNMVETEGFFQQSFSQRSSTNTQFGVSLPLIEDKLSFRISGLYDSNRQSDIYNVTSNLKNRNETSAYRIVMGWTPTDNFDLRLGFHNFDTSFDVDQNIMGGGFDFDDRVAVNDFYSLMEDKTKLTILEFNYTLPNDWVLTSVSSHQDNRTQRRWDSDGSEVAGEEQFVDSNIPNAWNTELRLSSVGDNDRWDWTAGLYYQDTDAQTPVDVTTYVALAPGQTVIAETAGPAINAAEDFGAFIHNAFHFGDSGTLTLGLRYTKEERVSVQPFEIVASLVLPDGSLLPLAEIEYDGIQPEDQEASDSAWTGTLKYQHRFTDALMAYASYDRGWRGGAANIAGAPQPPVFGAFDPEESDNIELGLKWGVLEGRGLLSLAAYFQTYTDFQYQAEDVEFRQTALEGGGTALADPVVNVDEVETYGIDMDFAILLAERWNMNLALTWNKAEFSDAQDVPCTSGEPIPDEEFGFNTCDLTGERAGKLPEWSSVISTEYFWPVFDGGSEVYLRGLFNAESEYYSQSLGEDLDSYMALDLVLGARAGSNRWDINLWVKNVTDETALLKAIRLPSVPDYENGGSRETGLVHVERQLQPRTFGGTLRINF